MGLEAGGDVVEWKFFIFCFYTVVCSLNVFYSSHVTLNIKKISKKKKRKTKPRQSWQIHEHLVFCRHFLFNTLGQVKDWYCLWPFFRETVSYREQSYGTTSAPPSAYLLISVSGWRRVSPRLGPPHSSVSSGGGYWFVPPKNKISNQIK